MTKGQAIETIQQELGVTSREALRLISELPSPHAGDETIPDEVLHSMIDHQREAAHPQSEKDFERLLGQQARKQAPKAAITALAVVHLGKGQFQIYAAAGGYVFFGDETILQNGWKLLPELPDPPQPGIVADQDLGAKITYALDSRQSPDSLGPEAEYGG